MEIPADMLPDDAQVPSYVKTDEDRKRFDACFALTRLIAGRDDPQFCRELFMGDLPTGELS